MSWWSPDTSDAAALLLPGRSRCRRSCSFGRCGRFIGTGAGEHAFKCVVALMTGVLEDSTLGGAEFIFAAPRSVPYARILNFELVENPMRPDACKSLGDF